MDRGIEAAVTAGTIAGTAGLLVFLLAHQLWIVPIWFVAPIGIVIAGLGGAAVGLSYATLRPRLPRRPWTAVALALLFTSVLAPAIVFAQLRGPIFAMEPAGDATLLVPPAEALLAVTLGLALSMLAGAGLGAIVGRSRRAAGTTMLAAMALAIGPGHNIPLLGGTAAVGKELAILGAVVAVAASVLVATEARIARRPETSMAGRSSLRRPSPIVTHRSFTGPSRPMEETDARQ